MKTFKLFTALTLLILLQGVCGDENIDKINVSGLKGSKILSIKIRWVKNLDSTTEIKRYVYEVVKDNIPAIDSINNKEVSFLRECGDTPSCVEFQGMKNIRANIDQVTFVTDVEEKTFTNGANRRTWEPRCADSNTETETELLKGLGLVYPTKGTEISKYLGHIPFQFNRTLTFDDFNHCEKEKKGESAGSDEKTQYSFAWFKIAFAKCVKDECQDPTLSETEKRDFIFSFKDVAEANMDLNEYVDRIDLSSLMESGSPYDDPNNHTATADPGDKFKVMFKVGFFINENDADGGTEQYKDFNVYFNGTDEKVNDRVFTVSSKDCTGENDIGCKGGQGKCNYGTLTCDCFKHFKGDRCQTRTNLAPAVVAVIIVCSILVAAILFGVIAVFGFKHYLKQKRKIVVVAPDFNKLRFVSIKNPEYPPEISSKFDPLVIEQLIINDQVGMDVLWEVTKIMPMTESDNFAKALVYAFARYDKALPLIMYFIKREVDETVDGPETLFRANSYATKEFKFYSKMIGLPYLFRTIAVLLQGMLRDLEDQEENARNENASDVKLFKVQYELDPDKMDDTGDENINVLMLQLTCQKFLVQILRSAPDCPGEFKQLCAHIKTVVQAKFPDYVSKAIGAFIFLRFFNTGITVPETYGLMPSPPKQNARRQLILLSKVLQNLANGVSFGSKESFMTKLNGFIKANQQKLIAFYDKICDPNQFASEKPEVSDSIYNPSLAHIYYHCANTYITNPEVFSQVPEVANMLSHSVDPSKVVSQ